MYVVVCSQARKALEEEKEISKTQHVKLEANLTAAQRTNQELEVRDVCLFNYFVVIA